MIDWEYIISSADTRIVNACPELPEMEMERVAAPDARTCLGCGKVIVVRDRRVRFCTECRVKKTKERTDVKEMVVCVRCGKHTPKTGYARKYCPECAAEVKSERDRTWHKKKKPATRQVHDASLKHDAAAAAAAGMSYGRYMQLNRKG